MPRSLIINCIPCSWGYRLGSGVLESIKVKKKNVCQKGRHFIHVPKKNPNQKLPNIVAKQKSEPKLPNIVAKQKKKSEPKIA